MISLSEIAIVLPRNWLLSKNNCWLTAVLFKTAMQCNNKYNVLGIHMNADLPCAHPKYKRPYI